MALKRFTDNAQTPEKKRVAIPLTSSADNTDYYATGADMAEIVLNNTSRLWDLKATVLPTCRSFRDREYLKAGSWFFEDISNTEDKPDKLKEKNVQFARLLCEEGQSAQEGLKFVKQYLFYVNMTDNELELSMRGLLLNGNGGIQGATPWKTGVDEADVAKEATNAKSADIATSVIDDVKNQSGQTIATTDGTVKNANNLTIVNNNLKSVNNLPNGNAIYWGSNMEGAPSSNWCYVIQYQRPLSDVNIMTYQIGLEIDSYKMYFRSGLKLPLSDWKELATTNTSRATTQTDHKNQESSWTSDTIGGTNFRTGTYIGTAIETKTEDYIKFIYSCEWGKLRSYTVLESRNLKLEANNAVGTVLLQHFDGTRAGTIETRAIKIYDKFIPNVNIKLFSEGQEVAIKGAKTLQAYNQGITKEVTE